MSEGPSGTGVVFLVLLLDKQKKNNTYDTEIIRQIKAQGYSVLERITKLLLNIQFDKFPLDKLKIRPGSLFHFRILEQIGWMIRWHQRYISTCMTFEWIKLASKLR